MKKWASGEVACSALVTQLGRDRAWYECQEFVSDTVAAKKTLNLYSLSIKLFGSSINKEKY